jgi:hypothetical protein
MSAPAFTPGPWGAGSRVIEIGGADLTPVDAAERTVAFVPVAYAADARLIAASPELYEALGHIRELLVAYGPRYIDKAVKLADGALAKARGETA